MRGDRFYRIIKALKQNRHIRGQLSPEIIPFIRRRNPPSHQRDLDLPTLRLPYVAQREGHPAPFGEVGDKAGVAVHHLAEPFLLGLTDSIGGDQQVG